MDCLFSVIIPVYNASTFISCCLDSIIKSNARMEIICINDGSVDNSLDILESYKEKDNRIVIINQENKGVSSARNAGLNVAKGEYILFVDSDDWVDPDLFNINLEQTVDLVQYNSYKYERGECVKMFDIKAGYTDSFLHNLCNPALWTYLFRREIINRYNIRFHEDLKYSEDCLFLYEYGLNSKKIFCVDKPFYFYRINVDSACFSKNSLLIAKSQFLAVHYLDELSKQIRKAEDMLFYHKKRIFISFLGYNMFFMSVYSLKDVYALYYMANQYKIASRSIILISILKSWLITRKWRFTHFLKYIYYKYK